LLIEKANNTKKVKWYRKTKINLQNELIIVDYFFTTLLIVIIIVNLKRRGSLSSSSFLFL